MIGTEWKDVADLLQWFGGAHNVGERIRYLRDSRGWTQEQLADAMSGLADPPGPFRKMDKRTIWKIENPGKPSSNRAVTVDELIGFAKVLDVTIADLLLPGEHAAQLEAFKEVTEAAERLQEVREAWERYERAIRTVRGRLRANEDARREAESQLERTQSMHYRSFARAHRKHGGESTLEEFAQRQSPTPLLATMEDALGPLEPHAAGWANGRHEPPLDAGEFVYSGGA